MPWEITDDVEVYAERAWQLLAANPAGNTIAHEFGDVHLILPSG